MRAGRKLEEMYRKPSDTEPKLQMLLKASGGNQDLAAGMMSGVIDVKSDGRGGFVMINEATGQATPMGGQQDGASKFGIGTAPSAQQPGAPAAPYPTPTSPATSSPVRRVPASSTARSGKSRTRKSASRRRI